MKKIEKLYTTKGWVTYFLKQRKQDKNKKGIKGAARLPNLYEYL